MFFFSSRRRHTRCALVTGVQTCALPIFSRSHKTTALGSGVIVNGDGYILTNNHVIEAADAIRVALHDGRQAKAKLVGADPDSDLAVLKIDLPDLSAITFNSGTQVRVGEVVLAIARKSVV